MDIRKRDLLATGIGLGVGAALAGAAQAQDDEGGGGGRGGRGRAPINTGVQPSSVDLNYKPRRVNKVIELWEDGQPIYSIGAGQIGRFDTVEQAYDAGKRLCKTYADLINYGLEHGPLDFTILGSFLRGLRDGGPTKSGHLTPAVIVEMPPIGLNESYALANSWIVGNLLDLGIHGVHICHARDPKAVEVYCQMAARYSFDYPNTPKLAREGIRGQAPGQAPSVWGMSLARYVHVADIWPHNPRGEIMMGVKIEDKYADANMDQVLGTKGVAFAEWGHSDNIQSLLGLEYYDEAALAATAARAAKDPVPPPGNTPEQQAKLLDVRRRVRDTCKKYGVKFLNPGTARPGYANVIDMIKEGVMIPGGSEQVAIMGREFTKRKMPV